MSTYTKNEDGTYSDLNYTQFPAVIDSWQDNIDLSASLVSVAERYKTAMAAGDYEEVESILNNYPNLRLAMIDSKTVNAIKHAIMALERMFSEDIETYIVSTSSKITGVDNTLKISGAPSDSKVVGDKFDALDDKYVAQVGNGSIQGNLTVTGTITGAKVYNAIYNDYAEFMPRGEDTEPGDIIALDTNCDAERYIKSFEGCMRVAGVHSDEFAHLIGGRTVSDESLYYEENIKDFIPVGLAGRVRTKVIGPISTGDAIVPSDVRGVGRAKTDSDPFESVVGYAVESDSQEGIRRLRVRLKG